jgi:hypothetical protein
MAIFTEESECKAFQYSSLLDPLSRGIPAQGYKLHAQGYKRNKLIYIVVKTKNSIFVTNLMHPKTLYVVPQKFILL